MTDTQRPWDRLTTESDPAYEAFAAYLEARWLDLWGRIYREALAIRIFPGFQKGLALLMKRGHHTSVHSAPARWPPTRAPAWRTRLDDARTGPSDAAAPRRNRARATRAARGPRAARRRPFGTCRDMAPPAQTRA